MQHIFRLFSKSTRDAPTTSCCSFTRPDELSWLKTFSEWTSYSCQKYPIPKLMWFFCVIGNNFIIKCLGARNFNRAHNHQDDKDHSNQTREVIKGK